MLIISQLCTRMIKVKVDAINCNLTYLVLYSFTSNSLTVSSTMDARINELCNSLRAFIVEEREWEPWPRVLERETSRTYPCWRRRWWKVWQRLLTDEYLHNSLSFACIGDLMREKDVHVRSCTCTCSQVNKINNQIMLHYIHAIASFYFTED